MREHVPFTELAITLNSIGSQEFNLNVSQILKNDNDIKNLVSDFQHN